VKVVPGEHFVEAGKIKFVSGDVLYPGVCPSRFMYHDVLPSTCSSSDLIGWLNTFAFELQYVCVYIYFLY
jgi:hypothetical protein